MKNILNKKLNKKGFTLAELLIVVAIIAILVAIAMPLFFGALDNAKEQTFNANLRALKAAGVAAILQKPDSITGTRVTAPGATQYYKITGTVNSDGTIEKIKVEYSDVSSGTTEYKNAQYGQEWVVVTSDVTYA